MVSPPRAWCLAAGTPMCAPETGDGELVRGSQVAGGPVPTGSGGLTARPPEPERNGAAAMLTPRDLQCCLA